ncbi:MAG: GNAT family N-acetyltransferase [Kiloniellales bacterium]
MTLTYRVMTPDDLPAVFELRLSTIENAVTMQELAEDYGITPASLATAMQDKVRGWICEEDGLAVGFAMGDAGEGEVQVVAVRPGFERRGIGKTLLASVTDWLFGAGHDEIWLLANPDPSLRATGFYQSLGWRPNGRRQGADHVLVRQRKDG